MYMMRRYGMYAVLAYRIHLPHFGVLSCLPLLIPVVSAL